MARALALLVVVGVLAGSTLTSGEDDIAIAVTPKLANYPGVASIKVILRRDQRNRWLIYEIDGPGYYRKSAYEVEGAAAPRTHFLRLRNIPEGEFEVRATVVRNDSSLAVARSEIIVVGGPPQQ